MARLKTVVYHFGADAHKLVDPHRKQGHAINVVQHSVAGRIFIVHRFQNHKLYKKKKKKSRMKKRHQINLWDYFTHSNYYFNLYKYSYISVQIDPEFIKLRAEGRHDNGSVFRSSLPLYHCHS